MRRPAQYIMHVSPVDREQHSIGVPGCVGRENMVPSFPPINPAPRIPMRMVYFIESIAESSGD